MNPQKSTVIALLSVLAIGVGIPTAFAEGTSLNVTPMSGEVIDLADAEKDRVIRAYAQFSNFNLDDGAFLATVINTDRNQQVAQYEIEVYSTKTGLADFNSHVLYVVTDEKLDLELVGAGNYVMEIATLDGSANVPVPFSIVDTRD